VKIRLRVLRVSRKTIGSQRESVTEDWRKRATTRNPVIRAPRQIARPIRRTFISRRV